MGGIVSTYLLFALLQSEIRCNDCKDDEKINCVMLTSMFNICNVNIENAAKLCPKTCNLCYYPNGNWAEWSSWSACSVTCDNASQALTITCTKPPPESHGNDCEGSNKDYKRTVLGPCPVQNLTATGLIGQLGQRVQSRVVITRKQEQEHVLILHLPTTVRTVKGLLMITSHVFEILVQLVSVLCNMWKRHAI
ncbi:hypothetical protein DPMN_048075 [Dreissena polymorpha]|uniref:ShKT domain-containing protein n=1 Tax=Dreissena polymorpha TaxID=45954 RepID=A0A9D4DAK0_DREPO|nr:hypothetical protein DPMN_048075 [Dreissena polymorpha]